MKYHIIREVEDVRDAFFVSVSEIKHNELKIASARSKLINILEMSITLNEVPSRIFFQKQYGTDLIMQLEIDNM